MTEELTFEDLDLSPEVLDSLKKMGVKRPTTVQQKAIPLMMDNMSVIAKAPTGTGKTFAFGIPILEYLNLDAKFVQALILCPTRELALQITTELKSLGKYIQGFRIASLIGGQSMNVQKRRRLQRMIRLHISIHSRQETIEGLQKEEQRLKAKMLKRAERLKEKYREECANA